MDGIKGKTEREEGREGGGEIECEVLWRSFFLKIEGENKNVTQGNRGGEREQREKRNGKL